MLLAALASWLVLLAAPRERERFVDRWRDQLSAMADDRKAAIDRWVADGLGEAQDIAAYPTAVVVVTGDTSGPRPYPVETGPRPHLVALLRSAVATHEIRSVEVFDAGGALLASSDGRVEPEPDCLEYARRCLAAGRPLADIHRRADGVVLVSFAAPIRAAGAERPAGVVVVGADPQQWLYPFLLHQPLVSASAESVLVRRDGDSALYLAPLRTVTYPPLTFRFPLATPGSASRVALAGHEVFGEFVDFRGRPIFAVTRRIDSAPWGLVVKIDRDEVLGEYRRWLAGAATVLGAIAVAVAGLGYGYWRRRRTFDELALLRSEARFAVLLEHADDSIFLVGRDGRIREANAHACEVYGYSPVEMRGLTIATLRAPAERESVAARLAGTTPGQVSRFETIHVRRDGSQFPVEVSARLMTVDHDEVLLAIVRDASERKRAERENEVTVGLLRLLNSSVERRELMQGVTRLLQEWLGCEAVGIRLQHGDDFPYYETRGFPAEFVEAESTLCLRDAAGHPILDPGGHPVLECMCGNVLRGRFDPAKPFFSARGSFWTNSTTRLLATTTEADRQARTRNRCNSEGYESVALIALRVGSTTYGLLQVNARQPDLFTPARIALLERLADNLAIGVAHRESRQGLEASERRYRSLFENMLEGYELCRILFTDGVPSDFVYLDVNPAFERLTGLKGVIGKRASEVVPGIRASNPELLEIYGSVALGGEPRRFETFVPGLGSWFSISVFSPAKEHFVAVFDSITERKRGEEAQRRLAAVVEQAGEGMLITDASGTIEYVNPAYLRITGYRHDELVGENPRILKSGRQDGAFYSAMWKTITAGEVWAGHLVNRRKDGSLFDEEATISPLRDAHGRIVNFVAVKRDVTRELQLQHQLNQAQRMEAVGRLAGGIAHDFNNLLQAVMSQVGVLRRWMPIEGAPGPALDDLDELVQRGASLTRQLLLFSRQETTVRRDLDVNEIVRGTAMLLRRLVREDVSINVELDEGPLLARVDRGQIEQVLMNLVVNASDAMAEGGRVVLRTGGDPLSIWIEVRDTGHGIPEGVRARLFEPFFTTKAPGKGTGLGLSVVHGIVTGHGGRVDVADADGGGAVFTVTLPRLPAGAIAAAGAATTRQEAVAEGRGERVLLVEDEEGAREGLATVLGMLGYAVTAVGSGEEAEALAEQPAPDVLVTDLLLPGITGDVLAAHLKDRWPRLAIVLMSGYTEDEAIRELVARKAVGFLQKPFDMKALATAIREALDSTASLLLE